MGFLEKLKERNEFPIVFIGAGISRRFLSDFSDWTSLLKGFWNELNLTNFFGEFNKIRDRIKKDNPEYSEKEIDYYSNIEMGTIIEEKYNEMFNNGEIMIPNFSAEDAYYKRISPFKKAIAEKLKRYKLVEEVDEEFQCFKRMLLKTQIILTTNYDTFIEDSYNSESNNKIQKYIGQKGFFEETFGFSELYKLHGCVDNPADIVISKGDYAAFEKNSVLISAKIISMMIHSPIIFIGYSLTDNNIRKIIKEFTHSLSEKEIQVLENRLILVEWEAGEQGFVEEVTNDKDLGCKIRIIRTDNFQKIFETISTINQGIAPSEIRKYQHVIKELIIDRGKQGNLNTVLLSPMDLDDLEKDIRTSNVTVAIGDEKYIFQIPDVVTYCLDYISDKDEISNEIRMRFVTNQQGRIPLHKISDEKLISTSNLHDTEKEKLKQKVKDYSNFDKHYRKIGRSSIFNRDANSLEEILTEEMKISKVYETISFNIKKLDLEEVKEYLLSQLEGLKEKGEIKISTELRRLLLLYDICKYQRDNA